MAVAYRDATHVTKRPTVLRLRQESKSDIFGLKVSWAIRPIRYYYQVFVLRMSLRNYILDKQ